MKNKNLFNLFIIFLIGFLLRVWLLDKPEGLWNDEYVSWFIASKDNWQEFFTEMSRNCHTPLYYFYLKLWMFFFSDTDISLRISSVIPSLISIPIMYLVGKELKNEKLGFLCAIITAISSFNIYFAQEVRIYSLLFLFSAITILFFIKLAKNRNRKNYILYFITNALLCLTHTLGIVFSFFTIVALFGLISREDEKIKDKINNLINGLKYIFPFLIVILILIPFLYNIAFTNSLSQFWSYFSPSKIAFNFVDYFSPIQTNFINSPNKFTSYIYNKGQINYVFLTFGLIPMVIGFISIINAILQKNRLINYLLVSSGLFFITLICLSFFGKIILLTKYSCEIYPIIILSIAYGLTSINKKNIKNILIFIFISLNLFYILISDNSAPKKTRPEGHYAVVQLLENSRLKENEKVILTYYNVDKFDRYLDQKYKYNFSSIHKYNFNYIMFNEEDYFKTIKNGKYIYKKNLEEFPNKKVIKYCYDNYISKMNKGEKIGVIFLNSVSFLSKEDIKRIMQNPKEYEITPLIFLAFSSLRNSLLYSFKNEFKIDSITQAGEWTLVVFEKEN